MLRLEIYQETAHFRIPTIGTPYLSYPLPPPSTIYGFLRNITNYESINYQNTKLSIQGYFRSVSLEKERLILETKKEIKTNIIPIQKLHQCKWIIHIKSPFEEKIKASIENTSRILRLGRKEDMIIDIDVKQVEEKPFDRWENNLKEDTKIYKTWNINENINGSLFKMTLDTEVDENKNIVGYKPINLIYLNTRNLKKSAKIFDGEYLVEFI